MAWAVALVSQPVSKTLSVAALPGGARGRTPRSVAGPHVVALANGTQGRSPCRCSATPAGIRHPGDRYVRRTRRWRTCPGDILHRAGQSDGGNHDHDRRPGHCHADLRGWRRDDYWQLTIVVGGPPISHGLPPVSARPVGIALLAARGSGALGRVSAAPDVADGRTGLPLLSLARSGGDDRYCHEQQPEQSRRSSAPVIVPAGSPVSASVQLQTGQQGTATLTFTAGTDTRQLIVVVGPPPARHAVAGHGAAGRCPWWCGTIEQAAVCSHRLQASRQIKRELLSSPADEATIDVAVISSNPNVATVSGPVTIAKTAGTGGGRVTLQTGTPGNGDADLHRRHRNPRADRRRWHLTARPGCGRSSAHGRVGVVVLPNSQVGKSFGAVVGGRLRVHRAAACWIGPAGASAVPVTVATSQDGNVAVVSKANRSARIGGSLEHLGRRSTSTVAARASRR